MTKDEIGLGSFEDIYKKYYGAVAATVQKFNFRNGAADDLIQDIFIQAWQSLSTLKEPKAFGGWLLTIARNKCLNEIRKTKKTVSITGTDHIEESDGAPADVVLIADDVMASIHFEQSIELLRELIQNHEGEPRATIARMFYLEKQAVKDISVTLDMKQNTVLSHLRRFRLVISKAMVRLVEEHGLELN
ncbi:RNA polymerase sigma factor [Pseudobacteriovorax antillogorgiicola]|uniref:RNA polymerase sigma factor, sigma-70 family n=1 Tax=Pseudobacteriovorax antillogorgiicola TaxID=1513793 RepID=A0A1Y6CV48_9BACT|nr:sigma-70 family RNA polymerase sigma factor [Pseudobacteriovorax antillogorgiicola]TCS44392.1 RNA polymerase sigma factor (sigma-70 family) [Pseudobacteriovorax antillogorgiicola]SMF79318.1 RNA polymerase sigma factor, sigma-70 family [Pseudobacteriovorax antillogorgiicola]